MKNYLFIIYLILSGYFSFISCSDDNRQLLEKQQIPIAFHLFVCDRISPHLFFLLKNQESNKSDSLSDQYKLRADIEIALFEDPNKIRIYSTEIKPLSFTEWITDSIWILNPGCGMHLIKQICIYRGDDNDSPLYASIVPVSTFASSCKTETQMPRYFSVKEINLQNTLNILPVTLFSTWQQTPGSFGYEKWCKQKQEASFSFSFLICDSMKEETIPKDKELHTGCFTLSVKDKKTPQLNPSIIHESIFIQEVKTTIRVCLPEDPDNLYFLQFCFPNKENPELIITDTVTTTQLQAYRKSGFWISENDNPEDGTLLFDLSQTRQTKQGTLCCTDSLFKGISWTPVYSKK